MTSNPGTKYQVALQLAPNNLITPPNKKKIKNRVYPLAPLNSIIRQEFSCCLTCNSIVLLSDNKKRLTPSSYLPNLPPISNERIKTATG